jgi:ATP-dependent Clp protease protease subunit
VWGNQTEHEKAANLLEKVDEQLVAQYVARTGRDAQQIRDWMAAETWMSASEAVDRGFADAIGVRNNAKPAAVRPGAFARTPDHLLAATARPSARVQAAANERRLRIARASV